MAHILKNKNLEVSIDLPLENYNFSRFDWTGKIVKVKFQNREVSGIERTDCGEGHHCGKGFYNEFGMDTPLGFEEAKIGGWFHKIGIGLLKKDASSYSFNKAYEMKPADFKVLTEANKILMTCQSATVNGYSYILKKEIELFESSFVINYYLENTGDKKILTEEYNHNFLALNKELIGSDYLLRFPFQLKSQYFGETVNREGKVDIGQGEIRFNGTPAEQFFFSNLTGGNKIDAGWELINSKCKIGISESGSFQTSKVNLWGWQHVISPELFFEIDIDSGESMEWSRTYNVFNLK